MANQIILALGAGLLPPLVWLWFWLREDRQHPEPRSLLAVVFICGALAVIPAYLIEKQLHQYFAFDLAAPNQLLLVVLLWAAVEELLKFIFISFSGLRNHAFDEPVDAMVYMITGALGFAALENILFLLNINPIGQTIWPLLLTGNFRFLGATLVHVVASATLGGCLGLTFYRRRWRRWLILGGGLILAVGLHAMFNYFIILSNDGQVLKVFAWLWAAVVLIILLFEKVKHILKPRS